MVRAMACSLSRPGPAQALAEAHDAGKGIDDGEAGRARRGDQQAAIVGAEIERAIRRRRPARAWLLAGHGGRSPAGPSPAAGARAAGREAARTVARVHFHNLPAAQALARP